jgi:hypothetical protein
MATNRMNARDFSDSVGHPALAALKPYVTEYAFEEEGDYRHLRIVVLQANEQIAEADFTADETSAYCRHIDVIARCRRQGIATAIYVMAEKLYMLHLSNFWEGDPGQTEDAKALWSQSCRPFG